jgi:hypothetical protein
MIFVKRENELLKSVKNKQGGGDKLMLQVGTGRQDRSISGSLREKDVISIVYSSLLNAASLLHP